MPPTPQKSSLSSIEAMQWHTEMEDQGSGLNARDRTVIAKMEKYLNEGYCMKLEIEELEAAGYLKSSTRKKRVSA